jgi:hypothetical protein
MTVILTNNSDEYMVPRFSVQHQNRTMNPYPWHIDQGPATLGPGEAAAYRISVGNYKLGFLFHEDAQIVATDAHGNYGLRAVASLEPDLTYFYPEAINNSKYRVWDSASGAPSFWQLLSDPLGSAHATPLYIDGRVGLDISLDSDPQGREWAALQSLILYQQKPFGIWLNLDPLIAETSGVAYGLEFDDGVHRLWVLFGARDYTGDFPDGVHIVHRRIPVGAWTYQEIDLPALYAGAGWESPPFRPAVFGQVDADFQLLWLRLMVTTGTETTGQISAHFGPIEQDYRLSPQTRMAQTLDDPGDFYLRLAQRHVRDRNYLRALETYQQALNFSPENSEALEGIQQMRQLLSGSLER